MTDATSSQESQVKEKRQDGVDPSSTHLDSQVKDFQKVEKEESHSSHSVEDDTSSDSSSSLRSSFRTRRSSRPQNLSRTVSENHHGVESRRDLEIGGQPIEHKITTTAPDPNDPDLVTWTGPDDPEDPKNWAFSRKWLTVFVVSTFTLISPLSSSMVAPALTTIGEEFNIAAGTQQAIVLSVFVLAYAIGPLA